MFTIRKKRKCISIDYCFDNCNYSKYISFSDEELTQIKKCNYMEYNIKNKIILNIPTNINKIVFGGWFNLDAQPFLHPNIHMIKFGYEFNQLVNNLPSELKHLTLGAKFNQLINNLPLGLKQLFIGGLFNQPVDMLPESLEIIFLSGCFNQSVDNLPIGLKILTITGLGFTHSIDSLPDSIEFLRLNPKFICKINKLPKKLISIKFICNFIFNDKIEFEKLKKITNANIDNKI